MITSILRDGMVFIITPSRFTFSRSSGRPPLFFFFECTYHDCTRDGEKGKGGLVRIWLSATGSNRMTHTPQSLIRHHDQPTSTGRVVDFEHVWYH
jgi:hypothetical protein